MIYYTITSKDPAPFFNRPCSLPFYPIEERSENLKRDCEEALYDAMCSGLLYVPDAATGVLKGKLGTYRTSSANGRAAAKELESAVLIEGREC